MGSRLAINKKLNKIPIGKKWASWKKFQTRFEAVQGKKKSVLILCQNGQKKAQNEHDKKSANF